MKFINILKISFHNLFQNKLRTFLTIIVLVVMGSIVMIMAGFGFSLYQNIDNNIGHVFQEYGTNFSIENMSVIEGENGSYIMSIPVDILKTKEIIQELEESNIFTYIKVEGESRNILGLDGNYLNLKPVYLKSNPYIGKDKYLVDGRLWNKNDENKFKVWVSLENEQEYYIGQTIQIPIKNEDDYEYKSFEIVGILNEGYNNIYIDYHYFDSQIENVEKIWDIIEPIQYIKSIEAKIITQEDVEYGQDTINILKDLSSKIDNYTDKKGGYKVNSSILAEIKTGEIFLLVITAVVIVLSLFIILLSIGSVANTIQITVEQNKKFFGVMKAVGMKNKTMRVIVQLQIILMIIFSILISYLISYFVTMELGVIIKSLLGSMFSESSEITMIFSPLIPIVTAVVLILTVMISTRKNLNKISKMDVISVISEVN